MSYRAVAVMILFALTGGALAETPPAGDPPSMRFEWVKEGPASTCRSDCREWIAAVGPITSDTARDFEFFTKVRDVRGATMVLDSGGGSVVGSLDLGRKIREFGLKTTVGRTRVLTSTPGNEPRAKRMPGGECASMCVFVLLGGVQRDVPPDARILVHQIWPGSKRYDANADSYTAEEIVRIQRDVGRIARYTVDMGADIELFELAMRIPPWERLRALSQAELRRLRLQSDEVVAEAPTSGTVAPPARETQTVRTGVAERGWMLGKEGRHELVRRHPLTREGDSIGHFEISLSCGKGQSSYRLAYLENRSVGDISDASAPLKDVTFWIDGRRTTLKVETSKPDPASREIRSRATAQVPAAVIEKMRDDPAGTLTIGTKTIGNVRTSIRVGGTGLAQAYPQWASDCAR
ncbi:MAG: hypothetical protein J0H17_05580 [Rhizobiales bacterium]|nr:hypothetical protein [Hyphomicrobiales bacterium]